MESLNNGASSAGLKEERVRVAERRGEVQERADVLHLRSGPHVRSAWCFGRSRAVEGL